MDLPVLVFKRLVMRITIAERQCLYFWVYIYVIDIAYVQMEMHSIIESKKGRTCFLFGEHRYLFKWSFDEYYKNIYC